MYHIIFTQHTIGCCTQFQERPSHDENCYIKHCEVIINTMTHVTNIFDKTYLSSLVQRLDGQPASVAVTARGPLALSLYSQI